jgi:hypothetical protein
MIRLAFLKVTTGALQEAVNIFLRREAEKFAGKGDADLVSISEAQNLKYSVDIKVQ